MVQAETKSQTSEHLRSLYSSNFWRIKNHFQYNPDFKSAGINPQPDTTNEYGAQEANFFIAPTKPEFSIRKLGKIQERLASELGIVFESDFGPKEEETDKGGMRFGIIRARDPLFKMTRKTTATEIEEGSAREIGAGEVEKSNEFAGTIERAVFVRLYPHVALAEIANYASEEKGFRGQAIYYLGGLLHGIGGEQLALFRRLSERGLSSYQIRDALIAKELARELNDIAQRNRGNITVGSRVSIEF